MSDFDCYQASGRQQVTAARAAVNYCPSCGAQAFAQRFCPSCGTCLLEDAPSPPTQPASLRFGRLVPLDRWWRDGFWRRGWLGLFVAGAVAPFLLLHWTSGSGNIAHTTWGFSVLFAVVWLVLVKALVDPDPIGIGVLTFVVGVTGVFGGAVAVWIERRLDADTADLAQSILTVGLPEELVKLLPVLAVAWHLREALRPRSYLYLGVVSGLTFGVMEAVAYSELYLDGLLSTSDPGFVTGYVWRLLSDSLIHGAMAGITALYVGFAVRLRARRVLLVTLGVGLAACLHGAYDRFSGGWGGAVTAALTVFVFAGYMRDGDLIIDNLSVERKLDASHEIGVH